MSRYNIWRHNERTHDIPTLNLQPGECLSVIEGNPKGLRNVYPTDKSILIDKAICHRVL